LLENLLLKAVKSGLFTV